MIFSVPQYINVEDKIAGPLTAKQLGWMFAMGGILFLFWLMFSRVVFFISILPTAVLFGALAFYRPHGQPLIKFIGYGIRFLFGPKVYVWKRVPSNKTVQQMKKTEAKKNPKNSSSDSKDKSENIKKKDEAKDIFDREEALKNVSNIAKILDSRGSEADENTVSILKSGGKR